jgi:hypothetical protein
MTFTTWRKKLNWRVIFSFTAVAVAMGGVAYYLGAKAFPGGGYNPKQQISVSVYLRAPARVLMRSFINETDPRNDLVVVSIIAPKGKPDPSLLIVQCPAGSQYFHQHEKKLTISDGTHHGTWVGAIIKSYTQDTWKSFLDCFSPPKSTSYRPSSPSSAATLNIAPPVLEAQLTQTPTPLYAEGIPGQIMYNLDAAQAPGSSCPTLTVPLCYPFYMPKSVLTTETLQNANLTGDRIDSIFPPGRFTNKNHDIVWQGHAGLSPSLIATNLPSERTGSIYIFFAGIVAGLAVSVLLTIAQGVFSFKKDGT